MADSEKYITGKPIKSLGNGLSFFGSLGFFAWVVAGSLISRVFIAGDLLVQSIVFLFGFIWAIFGPFSLSFFIVEIAGRAAYSGNYSLGLKLANLGVQVDKAVLPLVNAIGLFDTPLAVLNLMNLANAQIALTKFKDATKNLESALDKSQAILGWDNQLTQTVAGMLAGSYLYLGRFTEAQRYLNKSIKVKEKLVKDLEDEDDIDIELYSLQASISLDKFTMALTMEKLQNEEKAEDYYRQAITTIIDNTEYDTDMLANHLNRLGGQLASQGKVEEAEPLIKRSLEIYSKLFSDSHPIMCSAYESIGFLCLKQEKLDEAESWLTKAVKTRVEAGIGSHPDQGSSLSILGEIELSRNSFDRAEKHFKDALEIYENTVGLDHPDTLKVLKPYRKLLVAMENVEQVKEITDQIDSLESRFRDRN